MKKYLFEIILGTAIVFSFSFTSTPKNVDSDDTKSFNDPIGLNKCRGANVTKCGATGNMYKKTTNGFTELMN